MNRQNNKFLIQFRLHGYAKSYSQDLIMDIAKRYHVKGMTKKRAVPHITLYGPATTRDIRSVISEVEKVGQEYTLVPFTMNGFNYFSKPSKVIYLDIDPSPELNELRWQLSRSLQNISYPQTFDKKKDFSFHSTVAFKDINGEFNQMWDYVKQKEQPAIKQHLLRITIIGSNRRILYEYDLIQKRLLSRREALSRNSWHKTINGFKELQGLTVEVPQLSLFGRLVALFRSRSLDLN